MKKIISASRRTDLPRFYYNWLQEVLKCGEVELRNPIFKGKTYKVDVTPLHVHSLVLWSKDFRNVLNEPGYLENYNLYFQYTINNYSPFLEPNVPQYQDSLRILEGLLRKYRPQQFNIRFDPIIISTRGELNPNPAKPGKARLAAFELLCRDLALLGMQNCRVTTSYISIYRHVAQNFSNKGLDIVTLNEDKQIKFLQRMVEIAKKYDLTIYACANPVLEKVEGVEKGHCIDAYLLEDLFGGKLSKAKATGQRLSCGCHKSSDIGSYEQPCQHDCLYCYQRPSQ